MKITCINPDHIDANPSMEVYPERAYCFSCGFSCKIEDLDLSPELLQIQKKEKEDILSTISYIKTLPLRPHRGLEFPTNNNGYYIVYPGEVYYKKRMYTGDRRYIGPVGASAPLYMAHKDFDSLTIIEGEINLLSLQKAGVVNTSICSPGSAGNITKFYTEYLRYSRITCIFDYDRAGVIAGWKLRELLKQHGRRVELVALKQDFNDILQAQGVNGIKETVKAENLVL